MTRTASYSDEHSLGTGDRFALVRATTDKGRRVVIKSVRPDRPDVKSTEQLEREYALLSRLDVIGVVKPIAFEPWGGRPAMILEDAGGRSVADLLRRGRLDLGRFFELAIQMTSVLARVHAKHVIHRDVCPANFVLNDAGRVTLVDFGLATRALGGAPPQPGEPRGTLPYLAPEQTGRLPRGGDPRADLYSLGATFYEMLTGSPPFPASDPVEIVHAHLTRAPLAPAVVNPGVPRALSEIVRKLLAKAPEWRYQSAEGLLADLMEAEQRWRSTGVIAPFDLGQKGLVSQLPLPRRLYGRDRERAALLDAFGRAAAGSRELVVVSGAPGVGKTAFASELRAATEERGRFLSGTCDALHASVPLAPIIEAFRGFVRSVLAEPPAELHLKGRAQEALGPAGQVLAEFFPELHRIVGEQAAVAALGAAESQNRAHVIVSRFVRALSEPDRPTVLFLDDVQWAEPATLKLVEALATDPSPQRLLLVLSMRDDEASSDSAAAKLLDRLRTASSPSGNGKVNVQTIELSPLDYSDVAAFLTDALRMPLERVGPLARVLFDKTQGSPLFVVRLLRMLQVSRLLIHDVDADTWTWDLRRIAELPVSDNVIELLIRSIRSLPDKAARAVQTAACIGTRVELSLLAEVCGWSPDEAAEVLWEPVREGLLIPIWEDRAAYRFAHDRVHQAALSLLSEEERTALHFRIGQRLASDPESPPEARVFEIADHLNVGARAAKGDAERYEVARANLRAGRKARARSAYEAALRYFQRGLEMLPEESWRAADELWFALHRDGAESAYLSSRYALGDALVDEAIILTSPIDTADLCDVRVVACTMKGAFDEAVRWGREGLRALKTELPEIEKADLEAERRAVEELIGRQPLSAVLAMPEIKSPEELLAMKLLANVGIAAWFSGRTDLWTLATLRRTLFALEHGNSVYAPVGYATYAMLRTRFDDYAGAEAMSQLAIELGQRLGAGPATVRPPLYYAAFVSHWRAPLAASRRLMKQGFDHALECGDFAFAAYALGFGTLTLFSMGTPLVKVLGEAEQGLAFCKRGGHKAMAGYNLVYRQAVRALEGLTHGSRFDDVEFSEREFLDGAKGNPTLIFLFRVLRMQVAYLLGEIDEAYESLRGTDKLAGLPLGFFAEADHRFYAALTLAAMADRTPSRRGDLIAEMKRHEARLALWAENAPANFRHKRSIVLAEIARLERRDVDATSTFDEAIEEASRSGFAQDEALAYELAARFQLAHDKKRIAGLYFGAALDGYSAWGASAKVLGLQNEVAARKISTGSRGAVGALPGDANLDLRSLLKAAETLSGEVVFDRLLEKLMKTCIEAAGAERAVLVLEEAEAPVVRAIGRASGEVSATSVPLASAPDVPLLPIEHVRRSGEVVVLSDATKDVRFGGDPDIAARGVRSVLAIPLARHGQRVGVLYLENNLASDMFGRERVHLFELLSAHIAISLENSRLFEKLEGEVAHRTYAEDRVRFLSAAGTALAETLAYEPTLARVAKLAVPFLADWCVVDVANDGRLRRMAAAHADPQKEPLLAELQRRYPPDLDSPQPASLALRTGEAQLRHELSREQLASFSRDEEHLRIVTELGTRTLMALPLVAHGRALGAITLCSARKDRLYGAEDLDVAKELARRAALAIDNARLYSEVKNAVRMRDDFLSVASHELRTPITSLQLATEGLLSGAIPATTENVTRAFGAARRQVVRLAQLIDELLTVSSIEADRLVLQLEDVDLRGVVSDTIETFADAIARARCTIDLESGPPIFGRWDRKKLEQVVTNLLTNALKFGKGGSIDFRFEQTDGVARLRVTDHGIGIAQDRVPYVFERYERAVSAKEYGGLGLGLFIVRSIVEALRGTVRVDSAQGRGTTFTVELPLAGPQAGSAPGGDASGRAPQARGDA